MSLIGYREHNENRRKCCYLVISPFPTIFSKKLCLWNTVMPPQLPFFSKLRPWFWPWPMTLTLVPTEKSCHKVYLCEIWRPYQSKDMANVKVFADKQTRQTNALTNGHTEGPKTICARSIQCWGEGGEPPPPTKTPSSRTLALYLICQF